MILGVGMNSSLYTRSSLSFWQGIPKSGSVIAIAVLPTGTLLAVGNDHQLYTRATLTSSWQNVPNSGSVIAVALMPDGTILGVGNDHQLYTRATLTSSWQIVPNSGSVIAVALMPDGTILGVGNDHQLYTRATLTSSWQIVPNSGSVIAVALMPDGTILGVGNDHQLYTRATLTSSWQNVPNSGSVIAVALMPDGTILGVGLDNQLWMLTRLPSEWQIVPNSGQVIAVALMPDGTILGVGNDYQLYTRATLTSSWQNVPNSGSVIAIAVALMPDGTILVVGNDHQLYTRATLTSSWQNVPNSGSVIAVALMPDGTILGVGLDNQLYTRATLTSSWQNVPNSGSVIAVAVMLDASTPPRASDWLLNFTSRDPAASAGGGRPWGDGTAMAARALNRQLPWDNGSLVTPLVGGDQAMGAVRDCFEAAIAEAGRLAADGVPPGRRGSVYIADWLLNALRDLSDANPWGGYPWNPAFYVDRDETALGLLIRLMAAGISVRVLLWEPTTLQWITMKNLADEHWNIAAAIQDYNNTLQKQWALREPIGIVALDLRTAAPLTAALHQKMIVIRVGGVNVGFCGGVDLAFTRRDFGRAPNHLTGIGDWQSGNTSPLPAGGWPKQSPPPTGGYPAFPYIDDGRFPEDLPANVYGPANRRWHDHHLKLEGPIVATLEQQFAERWIIDTQGRVYLFDRTGKIGFDNQVQLTSAAAFASGKVNPLPAALPVAPIGEAPVQMWRTIPLRAERRVSPFVRGEFTVMAGVANAVHRATQLITIWDQYFWSTPLALLLASRLRAVPSLRLLIVLPPYGTTDPANELKLRYIALQALWNALDDPSRSRVLVYDMWWGEQKPGVGIYVHAKVQTYDDALLVCGSANMNRRSLECDAELDCAVMHRPTVRAHLVRLNEAVNGQVWTDFGDGWLGRFWTMLRTSHTRALVNDPFFVADVGMPKTPNGVPMPYDGKKPYTLFEPSSIGSSVDTAAQCQFPQCQGDPKAPGRLDEITFLLERCHDGTSWPWRVANTSAMREVEAAELGEEAVPEDLVSQIPRLTL